jgi:hypothetical protein
VRKGQRAWKNYKPDEETTNGITPKGYLQASQTTNSFDVLSYRLRLKERIFFSLSEFLIRGPSYFKIPINELRTSNIELFGKLKHRFRGLLGTECVPHGKEGGQTGKIYACSPY